MPGRLTCPDTATVNPSSEPPALPDHELVVGLKDQVAPGVARKRRLEVTVTRTASRASPDRRRRTRSDVVGLAVDFRLPP